MIKYLKHKDIDKTQWDRCVEKAPNSLIYAYSWYLDIVSPEWDALILSDYEAVMPLTWKKKWGVKFLAQPPFTQQLGWFGHFSEETGNESLSLLKRKYVFGFISLNQLSQFGGNKVKRRSNLIVELNREYINLKDQYSSNHKRNIKTAKKAKLAVNSITINEFEGIYNTANWQSKFGLKDKHYRLLLSLIKTSQERFFGILKGVYTEDNQLVAVAFVLSTEGRLTYLFPISSNDGYKLKAQFFIIDALIEEYAKKNLILDFEGSQIDSIARFYKGFGAKTEIYFSITYPNFLKNLLKKL